MLDIRLAAIGRIGSITKVIIQLDRKAVGHDPSQIRQIVDYRRRRLCEVVHWHPRHDRSGSIGMLGWALMASTGVVGRRQRTVVLNLGRCF
jgi:hypothetical protein